jgi:hypothetical protein
LATYISPFARPMITMPAEKKCVLVSIFRPGNLHHFEDTEWVVGVPLEAADAKVASPGGCRFGAGLGCGFGFALIRIARPSG